MWSIIAYCKERKITVRKNLLLTSNHLVSMAEQFLGCKAEREEREVVRLRKAPPMPGPVKPWPRVRRYKELGCAFMCVCRHMQLSCLPGFLCH